MGLTSTERQLLVVSKASRKQLSYFRDGVRITTSTTRSLDDLKAQSCADRIALATSFLGVGTRLLRARPPQYRTAIGRFYYAMYHSVRATVYFSNDGDDHQRHEVLPQHLPEDFPSRELWENRLKNARGYRNDADYDPYPTDTAQFRDPAVELQKHADAIVPIVTSYLRAKGCDHV